MAEMGKELDNVKVEKTESNGEDSSKKIDWIYSKKIDISELDLEKGSINITNGQIIKAEYYVRSKALVEDKERYYEITCPEGKCVYAFVYDSNNNFLYCTGKKEGEIKIKVRHREAIRFAFKKSDDTATDYTNIDIDFVNDYIFEYTRINNIYFDLKAEDGSVIQGVLRLPFTYKEEGGKTVLIMCAHGASGRVDRANENNLQIYTWDDCLDEGYATFDVHGATASLSMHWGCKGAVNMYYKAYQYIINNYNIDSRIMVSGKSMGGLTALNFSSYYPNVCRCVAALYPVTDLYHQVYTNQKMGEDMKKNLETAYGFTQWNEGETPARTVGFDPIKARSIRVGDEVYSIPLTPIKIWHGTADEYVNFRKTEILVEQIKRANCHAEYTPVEGIGHGNPENSQYEGKFYGDYWRTQIVNSETIKWFEKFK